MGQPTDIMTTAPLDIFNALVPKDFGAKAIATDIAYGPHRRHRLDLYGPRKHDGPLPVVVFLYGGSWETGSKASYAFVGRALAALGYAVAIPDYRLLPEVEYPAFLDDCADAFAWVSQNIHRHGGDFTRIALVGHSAGAYNASMLALDAALLNARGGNAGLLGLAGLSGPYDFYPFDGAISRRVFGQVPEPRSTQPVSKVSRGSPPVFLATGDLDRLVLPRNSDALGAALRAAGVKAEVQHYPQLGHAGTLLSLSLPLRFRAPVLADLNRFLERIFSTT